MLEAQQPDRVERSFESATLMLASIFLGVETDLKRLRAVQRDRESPLRLVHDLDEVRCLSTRPACRKNRCKVKS